MSGRKVTRARRILQRHGVTLSPVQWRRIKRGYTRRSVAGKTRFEFDLRVDLVAAGYPAKGK